MTDDLERLEQAQAELLVLYPRLADALGKDQHKGDGRSSGSVVPSIPVNPDVLESIRQLTADIPVIDAEMRTALLFDRAGSVTKRSVVDCITYADALWRRLNAHKEFEYLADEYARHVRGWQRTARVALGLATQPKDVGKDCPFCDGGLKLCGDEGELHEPDDIEAITWERGDLIYCPGCQKEWPAPLWDVLGLLIEAETERKTRAAAEAAETEEDDDHTEPEPPTPPGKWMRWDGDLERINEDHDFEPGANYDKWTATDKHWVRRNDQGTWTPHPKLTIVIQGNVIHDEPGVVHIESATGVTVRNTQWSET